MQTLKDKFKEIKEQEMPLRVKEVINTHLEKQGKPKKFDLPTKEEETTE